MAKYQVQGPDGQVHILEGPDGSTPEQVMAAAQQIFAAPSAAHQRAAADTAAWQATLSPVSDMGTIDRFRAGIGKGMTDLVRGVGERVGVVSPEDIAQSRQTDAPLMQTTAGKVGNVTGKMAATLPTMFIPGANTLTGAALIGAGQGFLEPTTKDESVLKNTAIGAGAGVAGYGVAKGVAAGYGAAKAAAQPFYDSGRQIITGRALNTAAGADAPIVAQRLQQGAQPFIGPSQEGLIRNTVGELVPGSFPTVAEVAGSPGVSALQRAASATTPDVTNQLAAIAQMQNAARANVLQRMAGSDGARDFAAAERAATADQLYGQARSAGVNSAALAPEAQANIAAMQTRLPPDVIKSAQDLARINGMPMNDNSAVAGMHYVKLALDDAISAAKASGNTTKAAALTGLQRDYLSGLDAMSPDYAAARQVYADMSKPINQMDVASTIAGKSINPLTGTVQPAAFARALNDRTAAAATGMPGATIEGTMTNQQSNLLQSILADLQRSNAAQNAGRGAGSDTVQKLAYANILDQSGVPTVLRQFAPAQVVGNVVARGADAAYGRANKELANQLAMTMLSPEDAAAAMMTASRADASNPLMRAASPYFLTAGRSIPASTAIGSNR